MYKIKVYRYSREGQEDEIVDNYDAEDKECVAFSEDVLVIAHNKGVAIYSKTDVARILVEEYIK